MNIDSYQPEPLPDELIRPWEDLLHQKKMNEAGDYYFERILPVVIERLEANPVHQRLREEEYHTLVSLMGFSPETTVIATAILRPKRLLIILSGSDKVGKSYDRAVEYLARHKILKFAQIDKRLVDPTDPVCIYEDIRHAIFHGYDSATSQHHIFDVTGGKKVMSATAGQVAWEQKLPLCYIEGVYDEQKRRPVPGTELLIRLPNPSKQRDTQVRNEALRTYASRNYAAAISAFEESRRQRVENRLDSFAVDLSRCYAAWVDLNFPILEECLKRFKTQKEEPGMKQLLTEKNFDFKKLDRHVAALEAVIQQTPLALIATYLELAMLYRCFQRYDFSCLLFYRCMEALVGHGLHIAGGEGFDPGKPDYALLGDVDEIEKYYIQTSNRIDDAASRERKLPSRLGLIAGLVILCHRLSIHQKIPKPMLDVDFINMMRNEATRRNQSILAHGRKTLTADDSSKMEQRVLLLAHGILSGGIAELESLRADLQPLPLE